MEEDKPNSEGFSELRGRAEEVLQGEPLDLSELSQEDVQKLIHELRVHQIELEMQNQELRQSQENLERSLDNYSDLYDFAPVGYFTVAETGLILEANLTAAKLLGVNRRDLIKKPLSHFIASGDQDIFYIHHRQVVKTGKQETCELRMVREDGTQFYAQLESVIIEDYYDDSGQYRTVMSDINEHKRIEEEIIRTQKLESVGHLAGGIAHDFNNILMVIMGNISLAAISKDMDKIHERLRSAESACIRAKDLTSQLLIFSKGGAPVLRIVSIGKLLKNSTNYSLVGSNIICEFSIPDDLWLVKVDEGQMSRVISNLVINACQAMPEGGKIQVSAENIMAEAGDPFLENGEYVRVSIQDQGMGIPQKNMQRIFDPYFTTKEGGSGLGLTASHTIIKNHSGRITVESQVNTGTTFHIDLPAFPKEILKQKEESQAVNGSGRILLMDDEEIIREILRDMIGILGYEVTAVADGIEAIEMYQKAKDSGQPYSAVILDLIVPGGMDGLTTMEKLLEIDPEVRAIVSSGYSDNRAIADYKKHGFMGVIVKPYKIRELSAILHEVLSNPF